MRNTQLHIRRGLAQNQFLRNEIEHSLDENSWQNEHFLVTNKVLESLSEFKWLQSAKVSLETLSQEVG